MGKILKSTKIALLGHMVDALSGEDDVYYMFASHPEAWADDNNPNIATESVTDAIYDSQQRMMFGKRVKPADVRFLAPRYNWESNTLFTQYQSGDPDLYDKNFYVVTDENKVYKCLYNNRLTKSTIKPTLAQNTSFTTSDGYVWKYMCSITTSDMARFSSQHFIPVTPNNDIGLSATTSLDVIDVLNGGTNYLGNIQGTVQAQANTTIFQIDNTGSSDDDFYTKGSFYIHTGPAAGNLRIITKYVSNSIGNWITVDDSILGVVPSLSQYIIAPSVVIEGDGTGAKAIATLSAANSVSEVTIISRGTGYTRASARISANNSYGDGAILSVSVAPPGGHGNDPFLELGADALGFNIAFANNEANTIPTESEYRRYGLLKNPSEYGNTAALYTSNTFQQIFQVTVSPTTIYARDDIITGQTTSARGTVVHSNSTILMMTGDRNFANSEIITNQDGTPTSISSIITKGDIEPNSSQILYINNTTPVERANTSSETVKLIIQL